MSKVKPQPDAIKVSEPMTSKRLGGWMRLWLVLVAIWGAAVAAFSVSDVPAAGSWHHEQVLAALTAGNKSLLEGKGLSSRPDSLHVRLDIKSAAKISIKTPTGVDLDVSPMITEAEVAALMADYKTVLERVVAAKKREHFFTAVNYWLVPSALLFFLGWAVGWVYRGFKGGK